MFVAIWVKVGNLPICAMQLFASFLGHYVVAKDIWTFIMYTTKNTPQLTRRTWVPNIEFLWFGVPPLWMKSPNPTGRLAKWSKGTPYLLFKKNLFNFWKESFQKVGFKRLSNCLARCAQGFLFACALFTFWSGWLCSFTWRTCPGEIYQP